MLNPNLGGLQSPKLTLGGLNGPKQVTPNPTDGDQPIAKPSAVFKGVVIDGALKTSDDVKTGDVVIDQNGNAYRYNDKTETFEPTTIYQSDFEKKRGDYRG